MIDELRRQGVRIGGGLARRGRVAAARAARTAEIALPGGRTVLHTARIGTLADRDGRVPIISASFETLREAY